MLPVLVCHSYFLQFDKKQVRRAKPYPPLATLQVAQLLRKLGHSVAVFDAMFADDVADYRQRLDEVGPRLVLIYEDNFNFLSKMCLGKMRAACFEMIARAQTLGARIIVAGSDATDDPGAYLKAGADAVLVGEGLPALLALVTRLSAEPAIPRAEWLDGIAGITVLRDGKTATLDGRNIAPAPEPAESPAWDLVDLGRYRAVWVKAHGYFSLNIAASRGCSFRCNWCAKPIWGNRYLQRSAAAIAAEMAYLKNTAGAEHIWFADDIFGFRADWVEELAAATRRSGGQLPFTIQTRADLVSERMANALQAAGCREAWIGAESGSQRVLDAMDKGTQVGDVLIARERLKAVGIRVGFFIQLGYPGEELEDILATRQVIETALPDDVGVSVAYPLPGTKFYESVKEQLNGKTHWDDSDELAMMFRGSYCSDFYRAVRDLLHETITVEQMNAPRYNGAYYEGKLRLSARWDGLLSREAEFRIPPAAGGAADADLAPR